MIKEQQEFFATQLSKNVLWRMDQLRFLKHSIEKYEEELLNALESDLGKAHFESYTSEILIVKRTLKQYFKNTRKWSDPRQVGSNLLSIGKKSKVYPEPRGTVLIISPFNYPVQLSLVPLITAIASGNTAIVKLSAKTPKTAEVLKKILDETFEGKYIKTYIGEKEITSQLLSESFDLIFFTGSPHVGKIVMKAAAEHLTPVILELGGKSPAIVLEDAKLDLAAERIVWGKCINAGQTCVAPDYVLVDEKIKEKFTKKLIEKINKFYGDNPLESNDLPSLIDDKELKRQKNLLEGVTIIHGGKTQGLKMEPTLVEVNDFDSRLMTEEIFGPILPIVTFQKEKDIYQIVNKHPNPLALYVFTKDIDYAQEMMSKISFGGGMINDTVMHLANESLPFGGVRKSGMSAYHGKYGFDNFSHLKSVVISSRFKIPFLYPPYKINVSIFKRFIR